MYNVIHTSCQVYCPRRRGICDAAVSMITICPHIERRTAGVPGASRRDAGRLDPRQQVRVTTLGHLISKLAEMLGVTAHGRGLIFFALGTISHFGVPRVKGASTIFVCSHAGWAKHVITVVV